MPVITGPAVLAGYGRFPEAIDRDWLGRITHLSSSDINLVSRRADPVTRLRYATQLVTVRAIGTFLPDPAAVPGPVVAAIAGQLGISNTQVLAAYRDMPVRWRHTAEIRDAYGYRDFAAQPGWFAFLMWLYRQAWADEVAPSALFRAAHRRLLARKILLPGQSVLSRLVATVRERAAGRVHSRLARARARSWPPGWRNCCWCPRGSGTRSWTCCAARRSPPPSPGWSAPWSAWSGFAGSAPATWTCPVSRPRGSGRWPATPTRPGRRLHRQVSLVARTACTLRAVDCARRPQQIRHRRRDQHILHSSP